MNQTTIAGNGTICHETPSAYIETRGEETQAENRLEIAPASWPEQFREITQSFIRVKALIFAQANRIAELEGLLQECLKDGLTGNGALWQRIRKALDE